MNPDTRRVLLDALSVSIGLSEMFGTTRPDDIAIARRLHNYLTEAGELPPEHPVETASASPTPRIVLALKDGIIEVLASDIHARLRIFDYDIEGAAVNPAELDIDEAGAKRITLDEDVFPTPQAHTQRFFTQLRPVITVSEPDSDEEV